MDKQLRVLGILYIAAGALFILGAAAVLVLMGGTDEILNITKQERANGVVHPLKSLPLGGLLTIVYCAMNIVLGLPMIAAGIGILRVEPWGRLLGILAAGVNLVNIPIGSGLGVYGLIVLFSDEAEPLFDEPIRPRSTRPPTVRPPSGRAG